MKGSNLDLLAGTLNAVLILAVMAGVRYGLFLMGLN